LSARDCGRLPTADVAMQKVNLYQQEFHSTRNWQRSGAFVAAGLLALLLVGANIGQMIKLSGLEHSLAQKNSTLEVKRVALEALRKNTKPIARDTELAAMVEKLRISNAEKTRAINHLNGSEISNVTGFSHLLQSLGRQRDSIDDIWLTRIRFSDGGFNMRLDGSSYRPELLPEFIKALNQEVLYRDREFSDLRISRSSSNSHMVEFLLDTQERDAYKRKDKERDTRSLALFMARLKQLSRSDQGVD
jgi:hypothetical protein